MDGQEKPTPPFFEVPGVLPMEGGYKMGICMTKNKKVMLWAHDGNDVAVQRHIEKSFSNVPKRAVTMYILDFSEVTEIPDMRGS